MKNQAKEREKNFPANLCKHPGTVVAMSYHVVATNVELWVIDGRITFTPHDHTDPLFGGFATAGLVDAHAHTTFDLSDRDLTPGADETVSENVLDYLGAGVTYLRDTGGISMAAVAQQGPRLAAAGRFLAPPGRYIPDWILPTEPSDLAAAATKQVAAGSRWVKIVCDWFSPETGKVESHYDRDVVASAVDAAHAAGARVALHCIDEQSVDIALATGVDSIEHACNATKSQVELMAERGTAWCPTITAVRGFTSHPLSDPEYQSRVRSFYAETLYELLPLASTLGVTILAGSDTVPPAEFWREVVALHEYGLSPEGALAAATTEARGYFGVPDLEEGAPADLVLYDGDPRVDPAALASPALVMIGGRILSRRR